MADNEIDWTDPVQVLRAAAEDMEKVIAAKDMTLDMETWYNDTRENGRGPRKTCSVCMAGSVLYNRLDVHLSGTCGVRWNEMTIDQDFALCALNAFRNCDYESFSENMDVPTLAGPKFKVYTGVLDDEQANELIAHARAYADILEKELT